MRHLWIVLLPILLIPPRGCDPRAWAASSYDFFVIGDRYTDQAKFRADAARATDFLFQREPWKSKRPQTILHIIENTEPLYCQRSSSMSRLLYCNTAQVHLVIGNHGWPIEQQDTVLVIVNDGNYGGSGAGIAVSYNGSYLPQVAMHELGHVTGNLQDEYVVYASSPTLDGKTHANCYAGTPPNPAWPTVPNTEYRIECKYKNWQRPSPCSIMRALWCASYNSVSRALLQAKLDAFTTAPPSSGGTNGGSGAPTTGGAP